MLWREFVRFGVVGAAQNGLFLGVFAILIALDVPYLLASVAAAAVALAFAFTLNRLWTFRGHAPATAGRAARFVTVWVAMVLLGLPVLALLVGVAGLPRVLAQGIVIVVFAPISYTAQRRWTFAASSECAGVEQVVDVEQASHDVRGERRERETGTGDLPAV